MIRHISFRAMSNFLACAERHYTALAYSPAEKQSDIAVFLMVCGSAPRVCSSLDEIPSMLMDIIVNAVLKKGRFRSLCFLFIIIKKTYIKVMPGVKELACVALQ